MNKLILFFAIVIAIAAAVPPVNVRAVSAGGDGILSVSFSVDYTAIDATALGTLIAQSVSLRNDTRVSDMAGADVSRNYFWASTSAHYVFNNAIEAAQSVFDSQHGTKILDPLSRGDTFDMTLRIYGNPGFGVMATRLFVPAGLELTHVAMGICPETDMQGFMDLSSGIVQLPGHDIVTGEITPITGPANAFIHWGTRTANFTIVDTNLLVYTFRVTETAQEGETAPIIFAFEDIHGYSPPSDITGNPLRIALPGNARGVIGSVNIR
ncbi:MAG: hypothetical protein FWB96_07535 [Defluviitaleaceae bacterium]|nr:hypothetical protein [Defluviitaleaceae bacterium]MCL2262777.1 hypothetical protein [Defluviitaleaceae bacterium]